MNALPAVRAIFLEAFKNQPRPNLLKLQGIFQNSYAKSIRANYETRGHFSLPVNC